MAIFGYYYDLPDTPIILANNRINQQTPVTATSAANGFPASAVKNSLTYERWAPATAGDGSIELDIAGVDFNTVGIAAHNLGTNGAEVKFSLFIPSEGWMEFYSVTPVSDEPLVLLFPYVLYTLDKLKITIDKQAEIGVIYVGERLEMPHTIYGGHTPDTLGRRVEYKNAESVTGNFLGRTVERQGYEVGYSFKHLPAQWYRQNFDKFAQDAISNPFFIAWYPSKFPQEVVYGWTKESIVPTNSGLRDFMDVSFKVEAIGHE